MIRLAELGAGIITDCHFVGLDTRNDVKIEAIASADEAQGRALCDKYGARFFSDYKQLIDQVELDGVIVALPNYMHFEACKYAIEHGVKYILCEKPLCNSSAESKELMRLVKEHGTVFQTAYMKRFNPGFRMIKEKLPELGDIEFVDCHIYVSAPDPAVSAKNEIHTWHQDAKKSGGGFINHSGSHHFDLLHFLFGDIESVRAQIRYEPGTTRDYYMKSEMHTVSGVDIEYHLGRMDVPNLGPDFSVVRGGWDECIQVIGTNGFIKCENPTWQGYAAEKVTLWIKGMPGPRTLYLECRDQWIHELAAFVECIQNGALHPDATDVVGGYKVDFLIEKLRESSMKRGEPVILAGYEL
jgi:predicted dehydrogenase